MEEEKMALLREVSLRPLKDTWILWFHRVDSRDYSLESYVRIGDMKTIYHIWAILDSIKPAQWISGMFFFMREGYRPMWEAPENADGGTWSKKVISTDSIRVFIDMALNCASEELLKPEFSNTLVGVSFSPKGPSAIIKIWNTKSSVNKISCLNPDIDLLEGGEGIAYTPNRIRYY